MREEPLPGPETASSLYGGNPPMVERGGIRSTLQLSERADGSLLMVLQRAGRARETCEVTDPLQLEEILRRAMPEEVILDLHFPIHLGVSLIRAITSACPRAEIVAQVHSRIGGPRFFSLSLDEMGLSLRPLGEGGP